MSPKAKPAPPSPADWSPDKMYVALQKQLAALDNFRGRNYREVENEEQGWVNLTLNILTHGFSEGSNNVKQFHQAKWAGEHHMNMHEGEIQRNFDARIEAFAAMLRSTIAELEMMLPQPEIAGVYESRDEYRFYRDLKTVVGFAAQELFVIDNYLDTQLFDVYMENINPCVMVRVLTNQVGDPLRLVSEKFAKRGNFELRSSKEVHDRVVLADDRCWVIGQSIKDAARKKPTYIVEHSGSAAMRAVYKLIWAGATTVVKG